MENIASMLHEIFPSVEMAAYLARCSFDDDFSCISWHDVAKMIIGSPLSLERKRELLLLLAEGKESNFFSNLAIQIQEIIQEMRLKSGEFLFLRCHFYDESGYCTKDVWQKFLTWEHIFEYIQECYDRGKNDLIWFNVEKWTHNDTGFSIRTYEYLVLGTQVCYASCYIPHPQKPADFWPSVNLNLPVPFRAGDIVTVDCRPFAPISHVVILKTGSKSDYNSPQVLYYMGSENWNTGAIKQVNTFLNQNHCSTQMSPLYCLTSFQGQLPKENCLLEKVSQYLNGDESRGAALWEHICHGVNEAEILAYIEDNRKT